MLRAMLLAGFLLSSGVDGAFDYRTDPEKRQKEIVKDRDVLDDAAFEELCNLIDDPLGPSFFHFDPPSSYFEPRARLQLLPTT